MEEKPVKVEEVPDDISSPDDFDAALSDLSDDEKVRGVAKAILYAVEKHSYSGPLPRPEDFAKYKTALPDAPERILTMAEKQQSHRIEMESTIVREDIALSKRGQILGFIITLFFGSISVWLGLEGHDWLAGVIATAVIGTLAAIFVLKKEPSVKNDVPRSTNQTEEES